MTFLAAFRIATAVTALCATAASNAQNIELPARKPGLWEVRVMTEQAQEAAALTSRMCIDAATDREMLEFGLKMSKNACKKLSFKKAEAAWVIDAECSVGSVDSVTRSTITGDFQTTMTVRIEDFSAGASGAGKTVMTQTAVWKGPCGDGMRPGDISMGNGFKTNIKQLRKLQEMLPNIQIK